VLIKHSNSWQSKRFFCICEVVKSFDLAFCKSKEKQNAKDLACAKPKSSCIFRCYVSYAGRCTQAEKNATTRSSTFYFARASQNKKSFLFPTTTQNILS
jgi:hypothetical protein